MEKSHLKYLGEAIDLAYEGMQEGHGGPFGAIVVKGGKIVGRGFNCVTSSNDPTAHAEVMAIRDACKNLNDFQLEGCTIYSSCEPCPMCLGAIYWARPEAIFFALSRKDAADIDFDDDFIYSEIQMPVDRRTIPTRQLKMEKAVELFRAWTNNPDKKIY